MFSIACGLLITLVGPVASAQGACIGAKVSTRPVRVMPGTLFTVVVQRAPTGAQLTGQVAGEPLHFSTTRTSFAAAPIDSTTLHVVLRCSADRGMDSVVVSVTLATPHYTLEARRVAPDFPATPDSALAARDARYAAWAASVSTLSHDTPRLWNGAFAPPRPGRITSVYGSGRTFNGTVTSRHMGTDWAGAVGAPVRAMQRGVVRLVERFYLGGNVVYVDHGEGLVTAYLHLSKQRVAVGDTVARGDIIGLVGATGRVTGPHLHIIARYGGVSVDAQSVLRVVR